MNFLDFPNEKFKVSPAAGSSGISSGEVIRFSYNGETKNAIVLVGDWNGKLHALALTEGLSENSLRTLLTSLSTQIGGSPIQLRSEYEQSSYTKSKSYRTYSPDKISEIKVINLIPREEK
jgi:hypothetical protein